MTYELAKQLKDAELLQKGSGYFLGEQSPEHDGTLDALVYVPTIVELIDACGDRLLSMEKIKVKELDGSYSFQWFVRESSGYMVSSNSLEWAFAKLWLKLNKA